MQAIRRYLCRSFLCLLHCHLWGIRYSQGNYNTPHPGCHSCDFVCQLQREGWKAAAALMGAVPMLLVMRHDIVVLLLAGTIGAAIKMKFTFLRWAAWALAAVVTVVSLAPPLVGIVLEAAMGSSTVDKVIPEGARDSTSIADRGIQLLSAIEVVRRAPILGGGMGSEIAFEGVVRGEVSQAYVDNGWAYLLVKMGIAGSLAFAWFIVELVRRMRHGSVRLTA